jgi:hypothetical protein
VRLAGNRGREVLRRAADRQARRRIAHFFEILEVAVRMARFAFSR